MNIVFRVDVAASAISSTSKGDDSTGVRAGVVKKDKQFGVSKAVCREEDEQQREEKTTGEHVGAQTPCAP